MRKLLLLGLLVLAVPVAASQSIGMAPSSYQVDEVQPGEELPLTFYLTVRGTNREIEVKPKVLGARTSSLMEGDDFVEPEEFSEQTVTGWIDWDNDTFTLTPGESNTYTLPNGAQVVANGKMTGTLSVPENAEPGYHAFRVGVTPQLQQGQQFGASVLGLARSSYEFRVEGQANREVQVRDVRARRTGPERFQFVFELENTGTVTTRVTGGSFSILNSENVKIGSSRVGSAKIPPGSTRTVETVWIQENVEGGNYRLRGSADYRTGEAFFDETVTITQAPVDPIQVDSPDEQGQDSRQQASAPLLLIIVAVVGLGSVLYAFGLDALWSFLVSGALGIAIFIITSGLPVYMLLLMVMGAGLVVYLNW